MRRGIWALVVALGCAPPPPPPVDPGPAPRNALVELGTPGSEPRQILNYEPESRQTEQIAFQVDSRMAVNMDGELRDRGAPPAVYLVEYKVNQVDKKQFNLSARLLSVNGGNPVLRKQAGTLAETLHWTTYDWGGNALEVTVDNTGAIGDRLRALMGGLGQLRPPLPSQAIGVGARWTTRTPLTIGKHTFPGTTLYELKAIEGSRVTVASHTDLDPPGKGFVPPGLVAGAPFTLSKFQGSADATLQIDLSRPGWSNSATQADVRVAYTVPSDDVSPLPHKVQVTLTHRAQSYDNTR